MTDIQITDRFVVAEDGLRLHVRDYAPAALADGRLPVLYLPGLTRTVMDFDVPARALAGEHAAPRRVLAMDSRGRGLSDRDPDASHYNVVTEARDVLSAMDALGIGRTIVIGSSRGGLVTLTLSALRPGLLAGVVFNDIGPVLEMTGLLRIAGYAGSPAQPGNFNEGAAILQRLFGTQFPALGGDDWQAWARRTWTEAADGRLKPTYDAAVAASLGTLDPNQPLPALWEAFEALPAVPLMVIRGEHSDLLSPETVAGMLQRRPDMDSVTIAGQGHTPLLADQATIGRLRDFAARCDP